MKNIITLSFIFSVIFLFGQTGPGGVGKTDGTSTLKVWYNPNNASTTTVSSGKVTGLTNAAGMTVLDLTATVASAPTLNLGSQNGYDEMNFTGSKLLRSATGLTASNFVTNAATSFVVSNADNLHASIPYRTYPSTGTNRFLCHLPWSNGKIYFDLGNIGMGRIKKTGLVGINSYNIWAYRGDSSSKHLYQNGAQKHNINSGAATLTVTASTIFEIGKNYSGQMAEVIIFKEKIGQAQRIIIDNYLAGKYGLSLETGDYYTQDGTSQGDFDHNIAGIGQVSVTDKHIDSQGTGIIRINTPSSLSDNDFLFWGEETKNPTYDFTTTANYLEQLNSKWRVNKENDLGTVTVSVNASDILFISSDGCNDLKLIVSSDSAFTTKTTYDMTLSGDVYTANLVSFANNDYFTFEYVDKVVVDNTGYYNGSGFLNVPNTSDGCYKFLVKSNANGLIPQTQGCNVRELEVEANGILVLNDGLRITVAGSIQLDGDIRLIGMAQLLQEHTGISQVTGLGKLYIDKKSELTNIYQSSYWTSPVETASGNTFTIAAAMKDGTIPTSVSSTPPNINFVSGHDGAATIPISISRYWLAKLVDDIEWDRHGSETTIYNTVEGYNMKSSGVNGQNYTFVGKPNDGDYSISVTGGKSTLLGNPYPSALDSDIFILNNGAIINTLYFWDGTNDNSNSHVRDAYAGGYATRAIGIGTAYNSGAIPARYMQVGQGFFVDTDVSGTIQFKNSQRIFSTGTPFFSREEPFPILRIGFDFNIDANNIFHRQLAVGFRGLTHNYEAGYDAIMYDMRATDISLKVINNNSEFVITGIEDYSDAITIPIHVVLDQQRDVTFSIDAFENFTPDEIYLKDVITNQYYNLSNSVSLNLPAGDYSDRFEISFRQNTATVTDYIQENDIVIIDNIDVMTINSKKNRIITNVKIFNITGQKLTDINANDTQVTIPLKLTKGEVIITKITLMNGQTIVKKILKK